MPDNFTLNVDMGNDAMQDHADIADLLRELAERLEAGELEGVVLDYNGNTVGRFTLA